MIKKILLFTVIFLLFFAVSFYATLEHNTRIPKIIHYVWMGDKPIPPKLQKAIDSWHKYAPDYKIMRWDESNCDIKITPFVEKAYRNKKWAFVSDYFRFKALYDYGGLYLDTDHYLTAPLDLSHIATKGLILPWGASNYLEASFIAGPKKHPLFRLMTDSYEGKRYFSYIVPFRLTDLFFKMFPAIPRNGDLIQIKDQVTILPFNAVIADFGGKENIAKHLYDASWDTCTSGYYYNVYYARFIQNKGYTLQYNKKRIHLIPISKTRFYRLDTKEYATLITNKDDILMLYWSDGLVERFKKRNNIYYPY